MVIVFGPFHPAGYSYSSQSAERKRGKTDWPEAKICQNQGKKTDTKELPGRKDGTDSRSTRRFSRGRRNSAGSHKGVYIGDRL